MGVSCPLKRGGHVHTIEQKTGRQRRRRHSAEFKAEAIEACRQPGISIAAAAMTRSIDANLLRRWIAEAEGDGIAKGAQKAPPPPIDAFIALPGPARSQASPPIQIEARRGPLTVTMQWPISALHECTVWLREVLK